MGLPLFTFAFLQVWYAFRLLMEDSGSVYSRTASKGAESATLKMSVAYRWVQRRDRTLVSRVMCEKDRGQRLCPVSHRETHI